MNVCILEHPRLPSRNHFNDIANAPLWSCLMGGYAASSLMQAGHDVTYLDGPLNQWNFDRTRIEILRRSPDLLCINAVYFWEQTQCFFDFLADLRNDGFDGHLNLFGFFPFLAWHAILEEIDTVDSIAVGECEDTLTELADHLAHRRQWRQIAGLAFHDAGGPGMSGRRVPRKNPDEFPFPLRCNPPEHTASILASRGCYNHCRFCPIPGFYNNGPLWRGRTPENVFAEMNQLTLEGTQDFYFVDPNFVGPGKRGKVRTLELMNLIRPLNITFGMETRPGDLDDEIMEALVSAGFQSLLMGIESGSASVLGELNKQASLSASEAAIRRCRAFDIEPEIGFLMFVPDSTLDDLASNFEFLQRNRLLGRLERTANLLCHCQIVMQGTSGYAHFLSQNRLKPVGMFGFEGDITFIDPAVKWMAEVIVHACLHILKEMSRPDSPVYWGISHTAPSARQLNNYLVALFQDLLHTARSRTSLPPVENMKQHITAGLETEIKSLRSSLRNGI